MSKHLLWLLLFEASAILPLILVVYWVQKYLKGFEWKEKNPAKFNYHPLFMIIGFVFTMGHSIITFRILPLSHRKKKYIHATLNLVAVVFVICGLVAIFQNHADMGIPPLYSLHSWIGIATFSVFLLQALAGLSIFQDLVKGVRNEIRASYKPYHVAAGTLIVAMVTVTMMTGLLEKYFFMNPEKYSAHALVILFLGLFIMVWAGTVIFILHSGLVKKSDEVTNDYKGLVNQDDTGPDDDTSRY